MQSREGKLYRKTNETEIKIDLCLDGLGNNSINTEIGFFNHMLELFAFHSEIDINLSNKKGIKRYSTVFIPMDEALVMVSLDISGRSYLHFEADFNREMIGSFSTEMVKEFFRALAFNSGITLHIKVLYGENDHHKIEGIFKAFGRALKEAVKVVGNEIPSSKGML